MHGSKEAEFTVYFHRVAILRLSSTFLLNFGVVFPASLFLHAFAGFQWYILNHTYLCSVTLLYSMVIIVYIY